MSDVGVPARPADGPDREQPPRVVVGVDGSALSKRALRWAAMIADCAGGLIDAVTVCEMPLSYTGPAGSVFAPFDSHAEAEKALTGAVDEVFGQDRPEGLLTFVLDGDPAGRLLEHAATATVLVLGARGLGGFPGLRLGSVAAKCVTYADCPVFVVHENAAVPDA